MIYFLLGVVPALVGSLGLQPMLLIAVALRTMARASVITFFISDSLGEKTGNGEDSPRPPYRRPARAHLVPGRSVLLQERIRPACEFSFTRQSDVADGARITTSDV